MFSSEINGYNRKEVNNKINDMLKEMAALKQRLKEKDKLNLGLANALEKSKAIEATSKNLFELKLQKISYVYKNLEKNVNNLFRAYPELVEYDNIYSAFQSFSAVIVNSLTKPDYAKKTINEAVNTENDTIRLLLNKMSAYSQNSQPVQVDINKISIKRNPTRDQKPLYSQNKTKHIQKPQKKTLVVATYPQPNESGFDFKEAINPKDDLYEIMKAFNLDD